MAEAQSFDRIEQFIAEQGKTNIWLGGEDRYPMQEPFPKVPGTTCRFFAIADALGANVRNRASGKQIVQITGNS